jgi:hypothetical protein
MSKFGNAINAAIAKEGQFPQADPSYLEHIVELSDQIRGDMQRVADQAAADAMMPKDNPKGAADEAEPTEDEKEADETSTGEADPKAVTTKLVKTTKGKATKKR